MSSVTAMTSWMAMRPRYPVLEQDAQPIGRCSTGTAPALIALVLYALLPLVRGVVTGLQQVPRDALESAAAMGMSGEKCSQS